MWMFQIYFNFLGVNKALQYEAQEYETQAQLDIPQNQKLEKCLNVWVESWFTQVIQGSYCAQPKVSRIVLAKLFIENRKCNLSNFYILKLCRKHLLP